MDSPLVASIAPQVDRLVWSVNDLVSPGRSDALAAVVESVGASALRNVTHFAPFWLAGPLPIQLAEQRFVYDTPGAVRSGFDHLAARGLLTIDATSTRATEAFRPLLETCVAARADASQRLWADVAIAPVLEIVERVTTSIGPDHPVAYAHRSLPAPESTWLRLFRGLTTLRYIRQHDHVQAWRAAGLDASGIKNLSTGSEGSSAAELDDLIERGLVDENGAITTEGVRLRASIEEETNRRNEDSWRSIDRYEQEGFFDMVTAMPGEGRSAG